MQAKLHALNQNDTWDILTLPPGKKSIGCKWVYKIKLKSEGSLESIRQGLWPEGSHKQKELTTLIPFTSCKGNYH